MDSLSVEALEARERTDSVVLIRELLFTRAERKGTSISHVRATPNFIFEQQVSGPRSTMQ